MRHELPACIHSYIHISSVVGFGESPSVVVRLLSSRLGLDGRGAGQPNMGGTVFAIGCVCVVGGYLYLSLDH